MTINHIPKVLIIDGSHFSFGVELRVVSYLDHVLTIDQKDHTFTVIKDRHRDYTGTYDLGTLEKYRAEREI